MFGGSIEAKRYKLRLFLDLFVDLCQVARVELTYWAFLQFQGAKSEGEKVQANYQNGINS